MPYRTILSFIRIWGIALICVLPVLTGCKDRTPVKIGFIGGTSGKVADLGVSGRDAVQMIVEQYNSNGGINGRRIELVMRDDHQDTNLAIQSVHELKKEGVVAIIGPMTSVIAEAIIPVLNELELPAVSPTASSDTLSGQDDFFFRVTPTTTHNATKCASYHIQSTTIRKIAVIYDTGNRSFSQAWLNSFKDYFTTHGGQIVAEVEFESQQDKSFTEMTWRLLETGAEGILIIANSMDSAMICQQIRKVDEAISLSLADWGATERLLEMGGRAVEGAIVVQTFKRNYQGKEYKAFRRKYLHRFKREPGFPGVYAYEAADVLLSALKQEKANTDLKATLLSQTTYKGLQGEISFDRHGDVKRNNASISIIRNRKFTTPGSTVE